MVSSDYYKKHYCKDSRVNFDISVSEGGSFVGNDVNLIVDSQRVFDFGGAYLRLSTVMRASKSRHAFAEAPGNTFPHWFFY